MRFLSALVAAAAVSLAAVPLAAQVASVTVLGSPCGASLAATLPVLGTTMAFTIDGAAPPLLGALLQSPGPGVPVPLAGCDIFLSSLDVTAAFVTDASGDASVAATLANIPAFLGSLVVVQGVLFRDTGPVLGLDVTNAVELRLGVAPPTGGTFPPSWIHGASNCSTSSDPPIQVHPYAARTWILRQSKCVNFEGPFLYLLAGTQKALLIDSGATASATAFPVRATVQALLDAYELANGLPNLQIVVAHTHSHGDHTQGDSQFVGQPNTTVVGTGLAAVQSFFGITTWPTQIVALDLGGRSVDVIPTPGHHATHISFHDAETGALFTGDTLYPGHLFVSSLAACKPSIARLVVFAQSHSIVDFLGAHVEMTSTPGVAYPCGTTWQPNEHALRLDLAQLLELDTALQSVTGPITQVHAEFVIEVF